VNANQRRQIEARCYRTAAGAPPLCRDIARTTLKILKHFWASKYERTLGVKLNTKIKSEFVSTRHLKLMDEVSSDSLEAKFHP